MLQVECVSLTVESQPHRWSQNIHDSPCERASPTQNNCEIPQDRASFSSKKVKK